MNVPAMLVVQSVPFAGLLLASRDDEIGDFLIVLYFVAAGLLLSLALMGENAGVFDLVGTVRGIYSAGDG